MSKSLLSRIRPWIASTVLLGTLLGTAGALAAWKRETLHAADLAAASQPAPTETVTAAVATTREHRRTTTAIGTVIALQSITLHNELAGTVHAVALEPGSIVEAGTLLVALDVAVEEAELHAQQAQLALAETVLERMQRALAKSAASAVDVDRARAERDIAAAQIARTTAVIERKQIRAPFRARIGMADVHVGQYLREGSQLTTLQGVDAAVHIDFTVTQTVAAGLQPGDRIDVTAANAPAPHTAVVTAVDARVDRTTRNASVRVRLDNPPQGLAPGASVRVRVPVGEAATVVTVPVNALRRGPSGDHVFVLTDAIDGIRAHVRSVRSGTTLGDDVVIASGLEAGERVAASGSFKLYESVRVNIADAANAGANANASH